MTRGHDSNQAYLYERLAGEGEHEHTEPDTGVHVARRGIIGQAARLVRTIIGRDDQARIRPPPPPTADSYPTAWPASSSSARTQSRSAGASISAGTDWFRAGSRTGTQP